MTRLFFQILFFLCTGTETLYNSEIDAGIWNIWVSIIFYPGSLDLTDSFVKEGMEIFMKDECFEKMCDCKSANFTLFAMKSKCYWLEISTIVAFATCSGREEVKDSFLGGLGAAAGEVNPGKLILMGNKMDELETIERVIDKCGVPSVNNSSERIFGIFVSASMSVAIQISL